ncbi:MAG: sigma-70 family RNA polymerase sigma factor [Xanthomonadales bacterium]|nr:sigma-70 family RNA polymerase sigma factor [Xanthomonadales bacterium]
MDNSKGRTQLKPLVRLAIQQGNAELVSSYLDLGGDVNARDQRGRTPLILAAIKGDIDLCRILLGRGADVHSIDEEGLSAIAYATGKGLAEVASVIEAAHEISEETELADTLEFEFDSEFFGDWLPEGEAIAPEDSKEIRIKLTEVQQEVSSHTIVDDDGDWNDVEIHLPDTDALSTTQDLQRVDVQEMLGTLIGAATQFGFFNASHVESISTEVEGLADGAFAQHLTQLLGDLGFIKDESSGWNPGPTIDDSADLIGLDEEAHQYLVDLAARINDPYSSLSRDVKLSVLLGRDGEERIGRMMSVAISEACSAISIDEEAIEALLGLSEHIRENFHLVGRISRLGDEGAADSDTPDEVDIRADVPGGDERSRVFLAGLKQVALMRAGRKPNEKVRLDRAIQDLELTINGIRTIHRLVGRKNTKLTDSVERLNRLECEMFSANMRLAISVASKYSWSTLPQMDLLQEAFIGLLRATEKFDFSRGFKFSTYATWWIRQAMTRAIGDRGRLIRLPVHIFEKVSKLSRVAREEGFDSLREMPIKALSEASGIASSEVAKTVDLIDDAVLWSDTPEVENLVSTVADDTQTPEEVATLEDFRRFMNACVDGLTPKEKRIIRHRFGLEGGVEKTLEEVGGMLNVTRERARQIEAKALAKLRRPAVLDELKIHL